MKYYWYYRTCGFLVVFIPESFFRAPSFWVKGAIVGLLLVLAEIRETWEHE